MNKNQQIQTFNNSKNEMKIYPMLPVKRKAKNEKSIFSENEWQFYIVNVKWKVYLCKFYTDGILK